MKKLIFIMVLVVSISPLNYSQWYHQNSGTTVNLRSIFFINENTGWACGENGKIIKTINGGWDWFEQNSNTTDFLREIQFVDQNYGWARGSYQILATIDGGLNWSVQNIPPITHIDDLQFIDVSTGWLIYQSSYTAYISKTTNGGVTWMAQWQSPNEDYLTLFFLNENYGWVTAYMEGGVLNTTNSGVTWTFHYANLTGGPMCLRFVNELTGWLSHNTLGSYDIRKSTDGGVTWFSQIMESGKIISSISFLDTSIGYAAGFQLIYPEPFEGFILKTTNGGTDWSEQFREDGVLNSIFFVSNTKGWAAGSEGKILVTVNGGVTSADDNAPFNPNSFELFQNYPNPFNPNTVISYQLPVISNVTLKVYDVLGNEIATLVNEEKQPGTYEVEFSIHSDEGRNLPAGRQGLPSGVYYYQLRIRGPVRKDSFGETSSGQGFIETKKMVLIK